MQLPFWSFGVELRIFPAQQSMDELPPLQAPESSTTHQLSESDIRYYFSGFYRTLKRYRLMTLIGWVVVVVGCASFPIGWSIGRPGGLLEILLSCSTIAAGLAVVWQSVTSLESYVRIAVPAKSNGEQHPAVMRVLEIMQEVDEGGWQEANTAIRRLEEMRTTFSLSPFQ